MRPSSRLLVPALTIMTWSIEAVYATFNPSTQDIYKRQVRSADYSTSAARPSYDDGNSASSPKSEHSSASSSGSDTPSTPRRSITASTDLEFPGSARQKGKRTTKEDRTYIEIYSRAHRDHNSFDGSSAYYTRRHATPRSTDRRSVDQFSSYTKDAGAKRKVSSTAHNYKASDNGEKSTQPHALEEEKKARLDFARRSYERLDTLHIARAMPKLNAPTPGSTLSEVHKSTAASPVNPQVNPPTGQDGTSPQVGEVPKGATVSFNTPDTTNGPSLPDHDQLAQAPRV